MFPSSPPLLARLRRRFTATAWLFALLMMAKATIATACMGDGLRVVPVPTDKAIAALSETTAADADAVVAASDDASPCWHEGAGGCHCACAHGSALSASSPGVAAAPPGAIEFPAMSVVPILARRESALRPPIA